MCKFQFLIAAVYSVNYYFISNFILLIEMWRCKYFNAMKFRAFAIGIKSSVPLEKKVVWLIIFVTLHLRLENITLYFLHRRDNLMGCRLQKCLCSFLCGYLVVGFLLLFFFWSVVFLPQYVTWHAWSCRSLAKKANLIYSVSLRNRFS